MHFDLALLGFGNVARALAELLLRKEATLRDEYNLTFRVTGIATRSRGLAINPAGLDLSDALRIYGLGEPLDRMHRGEPLSDTLDFVRQVPADLVMEATWLNPQTGQPATDYVRAALSAGRHVVTANKGPIAFAYRELRDLAAGFRELNRSADEIDRNPIYAAKLRALHAIHHIPLSEVRRADYERFGALGTGSASQLVRSPRHRDPHRRP